MSARIEWGELVAIEPRIHEVGEHVPALARAYNDPHNAPLLGHTQLLSEADVLEHYERLLDGAHPFLLFDGGAFAGDGDLRGVDGGAAELAFLIAAPNAQGKGLGTRFATMMLAYAFSKLGLDRVYAAFVPENLASRRVFEKLGYRVIDAPSYGDEGDVVMVVEREAFVERFAAEMAQIRIAMR